ncbi:hypothetical protein Lfu02_49140 [Longispora fulva]|uniref:RimJ/RimL family protein N-acetyltransferase n=1 Tax=Longispora fulva TaxID=619741 RepID=A0A8J7KLR7_9ACTN|nr:GNAT family protein [Longispora fulva]MBG6138291.1 RimJ/RimL family protein N-acetyltransferase [Longispora fulva]GIG60542.1 hypothetical protein Lfu02_49140 [Longispora fulva]
MQLRYRRFVPTEVDALVDFLTGETWPFHVQPVVDGDAVRRRASEGYYDNDEARTFWIVEGDDTVGLVRLMDLTDDTPLFDLRIRAAYRGRGIGGLAVVWLTGYVFDEFPHVHRIEGTTRRDNSAMRRVFPRCGYVKEAHYRDAWPGADGILHDSIGYAILRRDWVSGTVTVPDWHDEPTVG